MKIPATLAAAALLASGVWGSLAFDSEKIEIEASPLANSVEFVFAFKNTGASAVAIKEMATSCGCISAEAAKDVIDGFESSEIRAVMNISGYTGDLAQEIYVAADGLENTPIRLTAIAHVPALMSIKPSLLVWKAGGKAEPKKVRVAINKTFVKKILSAEPAECGYKSSIARDSSDEAVYFIEIAPESVVAPQRALFQINAEAVDGTVRRFFLNCMVE